MADNLIEWMRTQGRRRAVCAGVPVAHRGCPADSVLLVEQGSVFLQRYEANGNLLPICVCGRGAFVGLSAAILDHAYDVDATPRSDVELTVVAASAVRALTSSPVYGPFVARALAEETRVLVDRCAALQGQTVRDRVLGVLAELSQGATTYPVSLTLPMQELAALVGADLAHVCRVMRRLRDDGAIDYGKRHLAIRVPLGSGNVGSYFPRQG